MKKCVFFYDEIYDLFYFASKQFMFFLDVFFLFFFKRCFFDFHDFLMSFFFF